jgi:hypothetical protein
MPMDTLVPAYPIQSIERQQRQSARGRVCVSDGCETRLSVYNHADHCSLHAPMVTPRTRGRKIPASG